MALRFENQPKAIDKEKRETSRDMDRRDFLSFLKKFGKVFAASVILSRAYNFAREYNEPYEEAEAGSDGIPDSRQADGPDIDQINALNEGDNKASIKRVEKEEQKELASILEILDFDKPGRIRITPDIMKKVQRMQLKEFKRDKSMADAYREIGKWAPYLQAEFQRVFQKNIERLEKRGKTEKLEAFKRGGILENLYFLALPESHFRFSRRSASGADGPYQFMPETAKDQGLKVEGIIDERCDPIKSAAAAAKLLVYLFNKTGDWDMALSGYNGSYIWKYLDQLDDGKKPSYEDFCGFLEYRINNIREISKNKLYDAYKVKPGESIRSVARSAGVAPDVICDENGIKPKTDLQAGQILKIPLDESKNKEGRKKYFLRMVSDMSQNLRYPGRFWAIIDLVDSGYFGRQDHKINFRCIKVEQKTGLVKYALKKGETLKDVVKKYGIQEKDFLAANGARTVWTAKAGQKVSIPNQAIPTTLNSIASQHKTTLARLQYLNPAIKKHCESQPLPVGYEIRI